MKQQTLSLRQIMNRTYRDICGFEIPKTEEAAIRKSKGSPVYGEITYSSLNKLLSYLQLSEKDVVYDLGSGVGKVVIYMALATPVRKAIGIELSESRHQDAKKAFANARALTKELAGRCEFLNDDLTVVNLSNASVIYTCSTAFSINFMRKVTARLALLSHKFRLVTLQELPECGPFKVIDKLNLDMSWVRQTPVYVYQHCRNKFLDKDG